MCMACIYVNTIRYYSRTLSTTDCFICLLRPMHESNDANCGEARSRQRDLRRSRHNSDCEELVRCVTASSCNAAAGTFVGKELGPLRCTFLPSHSLHHASPQLYPAITNVFTKSIPQDGERGNFRSLVYMLIALQSAQNSAGIQTLLDVRHRRPP
jgi:hypothetical protein